MKKSSRAKTFFKIMTYVIITPIVIVWALCALLYLPPIQKYATNKIEEAIAQNSDLRLSIGAVRLSFPLKLILKDINLSKEGEVIALGDAITIDVSLLPLFSNQIEINYLILENIVADTHDLIDGTRITGKLEYLRGVARNVDFDKESANIRQLRIDGADIKIVVSDSENEEDSTQTATNWEIGLHRGDIENSRISVILPQDTTTIAGMIGKLTIKEVVALPTSEEYNIEELRFARSSISYGQGILSREEAPLKHIHIEEINICGEDLRYSPSAFAANIKELSFNQQEGVDIVGGALAITADTKLIEIKRGALKSGNGSFVNATGKFSQNIFTKTDKSPLQLNASAHIDKRDFAGFLTAEQAEAVASLPDSMLNASIALRGTLANAHIDSAEITIPRVVTLHLSGDIERNNTTQADILFKGDIFDTSPFTGVPSRAPHKPLSLEGEAKMRGDIYSTDFYISGKGDGSVIAMYDASKEAYDAKIDVKQFDIESFIASVPVQNLTMRASLSGAGADIFAPKTYYQLFTTIDTLQYANYSMSDVTISAFQANLFSYISLISNNKDSDLELTASSRLSSNEILNNSILKIKNLALDKFGISENKVSTGINLNIDARTNLSEEHSLKLQGNNIVINTPKKRFTPADINIDFATAPDSSHIIATNGDLSINGAIAAGYKSFSAQIEKISKMLHNARHNEKTIYFARDFERVLPKTNIAIQCGEQNILHNLLVMNDVDFDSININCSIDTTRGVRAGGGIYNIKTAEIRLDTLRFSALQNGEDIKYFAGVRSSAITPGNKKQSFRAALYGNLLRDTLNTNFSFIDDNDNNTKIGLNTLLLPEGLNIHIQPQAKIMGEDFDINPDNYINIGKNKSISANIHATDRYKAGLNLYTINDSSATHDISLELFNINLKKLTASLPFAPDVAGRLNSDIRLRNEKEGIIISCDAMGDSITYEGYHIGNEMAEFVYMPKQKNKHIISLLLYHDDKEYLNLLGDYNDNGSINGHATLTQVPLKLINAFTQESGYNVDGYVDGQLALNGELEAPLSNGSLQFKSAYIDAPQLGSQIRLVDDIVKIENSKIKFKDFKIYAKGDSPFKVNGDIDISKLASPTFNLRMQANKYELVNAQRSKESLVYGKLFLDINAFVSGPMQSLKVLGDATVLGNTNITYVMPESSIATNNELDGLVEFVNFTDSTQTIRSNREVDWGNITMSMTLNIEEGAWINADFNSSRDSYINLQGGGQLNMSYTNEAGASLTGRYTLNNGEMKYHLPIIPLKTFKISPGSYVNWTGDITNPTLGITALERVVAPVSIDGGNSQPVAFDVGLILSNSLDNMGLSFTMKAPENATIQDELNTLDAETLNKYAVTMLITGAYVGNNGGLTVSNALTSFLDARINDIAGDAMKSVSINVGITDVENKETGSSYTNYSFSFAKRFWNNRFTIIVGGEVNSGNNPQEDENSFINNVSLEWQLTADGNRYLRLFYDKNYESILEGEITETGVGYIYKRKLNNLNELLYIRKHNKQPTTNE